MPEATVIVPTYDHGPTLLRSVASALAQTVTDLEVLIVGDGVPDATREIAATLQTDPRVQFFDHPKGPRNGEIYRAAALEEARGEIVCYLSDDDLWLPTHVATMRALLADADFAHALPVTVRLDGSLTGWTVDLALAADRELLLSGHNRVPLTCGAHTLDLYRRLPYGWRTTPAGTPTDLYMWQQMLAMPGCRVVSSTRPTTLIFPSPERKSEMTEQRCHELDRWAARLDDPSLVADIYDMVVRDRAQQVAELRVRVDELTASGTRSASEIEARDGIIHDLQRELAERTEWAQRAATEVEDSATVIRDLQRELDERTAWARSAAADVEQHASVIRNLQHESDERTVWARRLAADIESRDAIIRDLQQQFEERTAWAERAAAETEAARNAVEQLQYELAERTAWAQRADAEAQSYARIIRELQQGLVERTAWAQRSAREVAARDAIIRALQSESRQRPS